MTTKRRAVYPGTFDPVTNGHLDIIERAARMVDHLTIGVAVNAGKGPLFSLQERVDMVAEVTRPLTRERGIEIDVQPFANLLMDFAVERNATMIVRGLRAVSDFEYEFQMCGMNARLNTTVETVFLMASERCQFISSRFVKEIGRLNGDIAGFVPALVRERLMDKFKEMDGAAN